MKIETVQDLVNLAMKLGKNFGFDTKLCFTDRFNEYSLDDKIEGYSNSVALISCEKIGSALQGTHRVLGGKDNE